MPLNIEDLKKLQDTPTESEQLARERLALARERLELDRRKQEHREAVDAWKQQQAEQRAASARTESGKPKRRRNAWRDTLVLGLVSVGLLLVYGISILLILH